MCPDRRPLPTMARELGEGFVLGQTPWLRKHHFPLKGDKEEKQLARGHSFFFFFFTNLSFYLIYHLFSHFLLTYIFFLTPSLLPSFSSSWDLLKDYMLRLTPDKRAERHLLSGNRGGGGSSDIPGSLPPVRGYKAELRPTSAHNPACSPGMGAGTCFCFELGI